ncbi:GNAT family N-acetyltransferase [Candidatus Microgenomates bacterium]|nr:GNAT family N-acetyltransferase [Candidatus Microgenomates bacterium]
MKAHIYKRLTPDLYGEWTDLWNASADRATAFNSPAWLKAAISAFDYRDVRIVAVRDADERLVAVAALIKYRRYGLTVYGAPALQFADKQSILVDWSHWEVVEKLTSALKKLGTIELNYCTDEMRIRMQHTLSDSAITFQDDLNYIVDLSVSPTGDLSSKSKSKIRRTINKLEGPVTVHFSQDGTKNLFEKAYEVEANSTKKYRGMSVLTNPEVRVFYEILASLHPKLVNVSVLDNDQKPIAYSIELWGNGTYQGSQKAFVKGYEYFQPSKYLVMKILEHAHANGLTLFDFGRGSSEFKKHFTDTVQPLYTIIIPKPLLAGIYLAAIHSLRHITYDTIVRQPKLYRAFKTVRATLRV